MIYTFDIPIDTVFFLFFALGFVVGLTTLYMIMDYAKMRAEYAEKYNCMGIRRPTPGRTPLPLPEKPKK
ncbi:hypothetical protein ACTXJ5_05790 [Psychrobacter alimentarius]|uniref:hypothetical protein n=1 Tax=Psychrobacter alimentarius TaxID=261164 RepID=UPI003FD444DC